MLSKVSGSGVGFILLMFRRRIDRARGHQEAALADQDLRMAMHSSCTSPKRTAAVRWTVFCLTDYGLPPVSMAATRKAL